ncbi:MAG: hypothetical protein KC620_22945 [Myxococcales bacterium]|nr:hypothetical protein [Myxococcales bacterium]
MRRVLPWLALLVVSACDRAAPTAPPPPAAPPNGGGHYTDAEGVARTLFRPIGTLTYGDHVEAALPRAEALLGYEFVAAAGDAPALILDVRGDARASLAVYGPRDDTGLWDAPLRAADGTGLLTIDFSNAPLADGGVYFILLRSLDGQQPQYTLDLRCAGCDVPACAAIAACDLYCARGYVLDEADGCRSCGCTSATCDDGCLEGEQCIDGECVPAPACADACEPVLHQVCGSDGRTYPNPCIAECAGVERFADGECPPMACDDAHPCAGGLVCEGGRCVAGDCARCPPTVGEVCAESGRTYTNLCQLECHGEMLDYEGRCVDRRCEDDSVCPAGWRCVPAPLPGNEQRCADPNAVDCIRQCAQAVTRCSADVPCPDDRPVCYPVDGRTGICTLPCRPDAPMSCGRGVCAVLNEGDAAGICLAGCDPRAPRCPGLQRCLPDLRGQSVCQSCDCPIQDPMPVCAGGQTYETACVARCAGQVDVVDGPCEAPPVDCTRCPRVWAPVCGARHIFATECEARCQDAEPLPLEACFPADDRPTFACRVDGDCAPTGCDDEVCAASPTAACPPFSPEAQCHQQFGACGCIDGHCGWRAVDRGLAMCLEQARAAEPPPPPPP